MAPKHSERTPMSDQEIPGQLLDALTAAGKVKNDLLADLDVRDARRKIVTISQQMRQAEAELEAFERPYRAQIEELKPYLVAQGLEYGHSIDHAGISIKFRKGYTRTSYPAEAITKLIAKVQQTHPELADKIRRCQSISEIEAKVEVSIE